MAKFLLRRLLTLIPVFIIIGAITFILMRSAPGGPWDTSPERRQVDAATLRSLTSYYGLDKPMWRQFTAYMFGDVDKEGKFKCGIICGNMGPSYRQRGLTVDQILFKAPEGKNFLYSRFGYSMRLALIALAFAVAIGVPAGIISALRQNSAIDYVSLFIVTIGISVPNFVIAIFLIIIFGSWLKVIPIVPRSWETVSVWLMPMIVLGFGTMARTARLTRGSMLEVMRMDYIRTARAKGLIEWRIIARHAVRNASIPVLTLLGLQVGILLGGAVITETIFSWPGVGRYVLDGVLGRDYPVVQGAVLVITAIFALINLAVDLSYALLDPRIRLA